MTKTDAFMTGGHTMLCLRLIEVSLRDLSSKDDQLRAAARNWFDPVMGRDVGVTFEDCVYTLGWASRLDSIRKMVAKDPGKILKAIEFAVASSAALSRWAESQSVIPAAEEILEASPQARENAFSLLHRALFAQPA